MMPVVRFAAYVYGVCVCYTDLPVTAAPLRTKFTIGYDINVPVMLGKIDPSRTCVVFSTTSAGNAKSFSFISLLPLTTLGWKVGNGFCSIAIASSSS